MSIIIIINSQMDICMHVWCNHPGTMYLSGNVLLICCVRDYHMSIK